MYSRRSLMFVLTVTCFKSHTRKYTRYNKVYRTLREVSINYFFITLDALLIF